MATSNPAASPEIYQRVGYSETRSQSMTVQGSVLKAAILVLILVATAGYTWTQSLGLESSSLQGLIIGSSIGALVIAFVTIFKPNLAPFTAPVYAALEGVLLGFISCIFNKMYPGIALQAISLSVGVLAIMLFLYGTGIVRATEKFKIGLLAATGAICLVYLASMIVSLFGGRIPYIHESGMIGIGFSIVVVVIASLNLILDFDFIEQGAQRQAPKYMEWYGAFSLLVTLIWMYLEILRLLAKLRDNNSRS